MPCRVRLARAVAVPLALALPPLFWVVDATVRASRTTLGRDQGIFQYVAWAVAHGAVDYRDVRDVNGPLAHMVHLALLALGGGVEHRFRVLDLALTGASFAIAGACVPTVTATRKRARYESLAERTAWALAGWVLLSGQYLLYGFWDTAQRESFFDWLVVPGLVLQGVAAARGSARLYGVVGALSVAPCFGKPTYALFTIAQVTALVSDRTTARRRVLAGFACGAAAGAAVPLAFLAWRGDTAAFARIQFVDVPAMYRFIWARSAADIFSNPLYASHAIGAVAGSLAVAWLIVHRELPWGAWPVAVAPLCAIGGVVVQAKGFPYHFHPVTACIGLQWLLLCSWAAERARTARRRFAAVRLAPVALALVVSLVVGSRMLDSPYVRDTWLLGPVARSGPSAEYYAHFVRVDFFPGEMRDAAAYLQRVTAPSDTVQLYAMDAYLLFLAERMSATPYIYAYDLDVDAALAGGSAVWPNGEQAERIRSMRDAHEADLLSRVSRRPPASFVFIDDSPLLARGSAWDDFEEHCPRAAAWVRAAYRETATFGHDHVWLRSDLADRLTAGDDVRRGTAMPRGSSPP